MKNKKVFFNLKKTILFVLIVAFVNFTSGTYLGIYDVLDAEAGVFKVIFLTTADTTWTVPNDWPAVGNMVEVIGGGGGAGDGANNSNGPGGGGGGGYAKSINLKLTRGTVMNNGTEFNVGAEGIGGSISGAGTKGGNTWFNQSDGIFANCTNSALCVKAEGGEPSLGDNVTGGVGGATASASGVVTFAGGNGGTGCSGDSGGGGGGAGGPKGNGGNGGNGGGDASPGGGGGGGGNGGGANGLNADAICTANTGATGGSGGNNYLGYGGATVSSAANAGTDGGGGVGGDDGIEGGSGSNGIEWRSSLGVIAGSGGGGGGGGDTEGGGDGVGYGSGGGGGEVNSGALGDGGPGLIVITYVPTGHVIRGGVKIRGKVIFR
ncbi:MAG: hypothetical protein A2831_01340 [Candidatus Yanofskybacteria bacterium RIFCSPHIGHO2_01_FULL_44_17]|uniref:Uncharacterized protein n=1 Tax=Candidatus Yanofskybacteria bacterium RIFCSPHIGHO2_01_FULL_44_17 TaxID=1802668 RepID=A0A1F8EZK4_9BACT|nr:MAG: hypothetical protein A2831_01340 [Candidatus Yanofskybacteria bacterium RIFCSPHIGHO2_01_FULL_44_17]